MTRRFRIRYALATGLAAAAVLPRPFAAQETTPGVTLGVSQRLETSDNLELDADSPGRTTFATTDLTFGLLTGTPLSQLSLNGGISYRQQDAPLDGDDEGFFDNRRLGFAYSREAAAARLTLSGRYRENRIAFERPLEQFINEDGEIELDEDAEDLEGTGTRRSHALDATLEWGVGAPVGVTLDAGTSGVDYDDVSDADLVRSTRNEVGLGLRLRLSPVAEANIGARYGTFESDDDEETTVDTGTLDMSILYELSPITRIEAGLGYSEIEREEAGEVTRTDGLSGQLSFQRDLPNGRITADYATAITEDGRQNSVSLGRDLVLPTGALSGTIGLSAFDGSDPQPTATLTWRQDLPSGDIGLNLRRALAVDEDGDRTATTAVALGYDYQINAISGLSFDVTYSAIERSESDERTAAASLTAAYSHALTEDWSLDAGYTHRVRDETDEGEARSNTVFVSLGRQFDLRP